MKFLNKQKLLIIITILIIGIGMLKDSNTFKIMSERNTSEITKGQLTKIIYYSIIIGALACRWSIILNENFNFLKNKKIKNLFKISSTYKY